MDSAVEFRLAKYIYPNDLCRILRQSDFRVFRGVGFLLTPRIEIFTRISKVSKGLELSPKDKIWTWTEA